MATARRSCGVKRFSDPTLGEEQGGAHLPGPTRRQGALAAHREIYRGGKLPPHQPLPQRSPATDGERVVAVFGSAGAVCYDLENFYAMRSADLSHGAPPPLRSFMGIWFIFTVAPTPRPISSPSTNERAKPCGSSPILPSTRGAPMIPQQQNSNGSAASPPILCHQTGPELVMNYPGSLAGMICAWANACGFVKASTRSSTPPLSRGKRDRRHGRIFRYFCRCDCRRQGVSPRKPFAHRTHAHRQAAA